MQVSNVSFGISPQYGFSKVSGELLESVGDAILALDNMGIKINANIVDKKTGLNTATLVSESGEHYIDVLKKGNIDFSTGKGSDPFEAVTNLLQQISGKTLGSFNFDRNIYKKLGRAPKINGLNLSA